MTITLGSLFDGSGGFPLAGVLCGIEPVWASEIEPYPIAVTKSRFPNMKHLGDISKLNGGKIDPVDIITFGSPCQDLSVAGKRAGLKHESNGDQETTRSGLFMEAVRIIKEMRGATNGKYPRFALWENVPGAFSSNKGEDFRIVLEELIKISEAKAAMPPAPKGGWPYADAYVGDGWSLAYRTFDAQYWGVPQRRRRIYLVADFAGGCAPGILFEREGVRGYFEKGKSPWKRVTADVEGSIGTDDNKRDLINALPIGFDGKNSLLTGDITSTLGVNCGSSSGRTGVIQPKSFSNVATTLRAGAGAPKHEADFVGRLVLQPLAFAQNQRNEVRDLKDKAGALAANQGMKQQTYIVEETKVNPTTVYSFDSLGSNSMKSSNPHSGCRQVEIAKTLDTTDPNPCKNQGGMAIVQPLVLFEPRSQDGVPRIHEEISPTLNTAQGGQRQPCVALPVYCIQGNCIDRSDKAGCNGKGWREDTSFTLNTIDRPAIVFAVDQGGGKSGANFHFDMSPTLTCTHGGEPAIAYTMTTGSFTTISKNVSSTLTTRDYKDPPLICFNDNTHTYRQKDYTTYVEGEAGTLKAEGGSYGGGSENLVVMQDFCYIVRRLTPIECARLQGFADDWGVPEHKDDFTDEEYRFWLEVRNTHSVINGRKKKDYTKAQMLTWYNKLHSKASEYKMWGNGVALPPTLYCMQGIYDVLSGTKPQ